MIDVNEARQRAAMLVGGGYHTVQRTLFAALFLASLAAWPPPPLAAQAGAPAPDPRLSDAMVRLQLQHTKLWLAGRLSNWKLAAYELGQIDAGLRDLPAAMPGNPDHTSASLAALRSAIQTRDTRAFAQTYVDLTNGCNACHRAAGFDAITIQVPTQSPFPDQLFVDQVGEGRALAQRVCSDCHAVSDGANQARRSSSLPAPTFAEIAARPSFSTGAVRQLLASNHRRVGPDQGMSNPRLADYQIEEIVALFETLRADRRR